MIQVPYDIKVAMQYNNLMTKENQNPNLSAKANNQLGILLTNLPRRSFRKTLTDIGSGAGLWSAMLSPYFGQIVSIEPNTDLLDKQKELFRRLHLENIDMYPDSMPDCISKLHSEAALLSDCIGYVNDWLFVFNKLLEDKFLQWVAISGGPDDERFDNKLEFLTPYHSINNRRPFNPGDEWLLRDIASEQGWATKMFDLIKDEIVNEGCLADRWLLILER